MDPMGNNIITTVTNPILAWQLDLMWLKQCQQKVIISQLRKYIIGYYRCYECLCQPFPWLWFSHRFTIVLATRTPTVSPRNGAMRLLHCTKVLRGHVGSEERDRDLPDVSPRIYGVFSWCFMGIQWDILESYYITKHI